MPWTLWSESLRLLSRLKGAQWQCSPSETELNIRMHKAISIIQFKVEGQIIKEHPEFCLEDRNLLHRIDLDKGTILLEGGEQEMLDNHFHHGSG